MFLIFAASSNVIHDFLPLHSLRLASESISPHKEHEEDLLAAMIILNFYNDLDNVFAIPYFLRKKRESL